MHRITSLTRSRERLLVLRSVQALQAVMSTEPTDRPRAEAAVRKLYQAAGLDEPRHVLWFTSPLVGIAALGALRAVNLVKRQETEIEQFNGMTTLGLDHVTDEMTVNLFYYIQGRWAASRPSLDPWGAFGDIMQSELTEDIREDERARYEFAKKMLEQLPKWLQMHLEPLWAPLKDRLWLIPEYRSYRGSWEASHVGMFSFLTEIVSVETSWVEAVKARHEIAQSAGWWWPYRDFVVMTDRPTVLKVDDEGRMHSADGPALEYSDGYGVWAWHGSRVPSRAITDEPSIERRVVEPNKTVLRILHERARLAETS